MHSSTAGSPLVCISDAWGQRFVRLPDRPFKHLGLKLAELAAQLRVLAGQALHDGGVAGSQRRVASTQVLVTCTYQIQSSLPVY